MDPADLLTNARRRLDDAVAFLNTTAETVDAERLFVALFTRLLMGPSPDASDATHGHLTAMIEVPAFYLYPHFSGPPRRSPDARDAWQAYEAVDTIFQCESVLLRFDVGKTGGDVDELVSHLRGQAHVVRGSAYPEQTRAEILAITRPLETWFEQRTGIKPSRAIELVDAIWELQQSRIIDQTHRLAPLRRVAELEWRQAKKTPKRKRTNAQNGLLASFKTADEAAAAAIAEPASAVLVRDALDWLPVRRDDVGTTPPPSDAEWNGLLQLIGLSQQTRLNITRETMLRRPLYVLTDGRVLVHTPANTFDQIWNAFEETARSDQKFLDKRFNKSKHDWLVRETAECLRRLFRPDTVYCSVTYPDPDKPPGATAEMDCAVIWPPFFLPVEAKARQFRLESMLGDVGRLRSDIEKNVAEAFDQARRAMRYVASVDTATFTESSSGRSFSIRRAEIMRAYPVAVTQHLLSDIATRLHTLTSLNLFSGETYPWSLSIGDLDVITRFCEGPDVLLHYIERRLSLPTKLRLQGDDLDLYGLYLDNRLGPDLLEGRSPDAVWLAGFQHRFDVYFAAADDEERRDAAAQIRLAIPAEVRSVLTELRRRSGREVRWIAFGLLGLSRQSLAAIAQMMRNARLQRPAPGYFRAFAHDAGDVVVSVTVGNPGAERDLERRTELRTLAEKFRRKKAKAIGFGIIVGDEAPFHACAWVEGETKPDAELNRLLDEAMPPRTIVRGSDLPGRNEPCFCGSGRKFKKCCLPDVV